MNFEFSERTKTLDGTATREIFKLLVRPEIVSFAGGLPSADCIPTDIIKSLANEILSSSDALKVLQYGTTEGLEELRLAFRRYIEDMGIKLDDNTHDILPISGGQQAIDLMLKALTNENDYVLVENPTYLAFLQIAKSYNVRVIGVNSHIDGLDLDDLEQKIKRFNPKLLYVVPTFSNPTGRTYSLENRRYIADLTAKYGVAVLEDDPYSRLRFDGTAVDALKSFDRTGNVCYVTSLSKVLSPGLRVGAAYADKALIRKMVVIKQGTDLHTSNLSQSIAAKFLERGHIYESINRSIPIYQGRQRAMKKAIQSYMPTEFRYNEPMGGLFYWGSFEGVDIDTREHLKTAVERNVVYIQGSVFYPCESEGRCSLRLNFSNETRERIEEGIRNLGQMFKEIIAQKRRCVKSKA